MPPLRGGPTHWNMEGVRMRGQGQHGGGIFIALCLSKHYWYDWFHLLPKSEPLIVWCRINSPVAKMKCWQCTSPQTTDTRFNFSFHVNISPIYAISISCIWDYFPISRWKGDKTGYFGTKLIFLNVTQWLQVSEVLRSMLPLNIYNRTVDMTICKLPSLSVTHFGLAQT